MDDAADIAHALGGWRSGKGYICRCLVPSHGRGRGDHNPSLSIRDGDSGLMVNCFAGCDPRDVLDVLRERGLIESKLTAFRKRISQRCSVTLHEPDRNALTIWQESEPAGAIVRAYLISRGITIEPPASLRSGTTDGTVMPTMVAAVQRPDGKIVAVQTTFLTSAGQKAQVLRPRNTTGALGAGAVRLAKASETLGLAEGTETALSAMQLVGVPVWACSGASRMHRVTAVRHTGGDTVSYYGDDTVSTSHVAQCAAAPHRVKFHTDATVAAHFQRR